MKRVLLFIALSLMSAYTLAQSQITEKGYFYSPFGFVCKDGNIYTADMKTLVRYGYKSKYGRTGYYSYDIHIPEGAEVIPSNLLYHPTPHHDIRSTEDVDYKVYIPSSVRYIAVDAFMFAFVSFESTDGIGDSANEITQSNEKVKEIARYNLSGQKINRPEMGINIVMMSNETVKKELVK